MKISKIVSGIAIGLLVFIAVGCNAQGTDTSGMQVSSANTINTLQQVSVDSILDTSDLFTERDMEQVADFNDVIELVLADNSEVVISEKGTYLLSGSFTDLTIVVEADDDANLQLVLDNLEITNEDMPAIYVKSADKVFVTTGDNESVLSVTGDYQDDGDTNLDAVIFSRSDLVLNGTGSLDVVSIQGNGITSKDDLKITGGTLTIEAHDDGLEANDSIRIYDGDISIEAGSDALHSENDDDPLSGYIYVHDGSLEITAADDGIRGNSIVQIDGGNIIINTCQEGLEATQIQINGGILDIYATDDGINAASKSTMDVLIEIYGGDISVEMASGDTDAFDSNGDLYIYGGNIDVEAQSSFDADGTAQLVGGTVTINGEVVSELPQGRVGGSRRHG